MLIKLLQTQLNLANLAILIKSLKGGFNKIPKNFEKQFYILLDSSLDEDKRIILAHKIKEQ